VARPWSSNLDGAKIVEWLKKSPAIQLPAVRNPLLVVESERQTWMWRPSPGGILCAGVDASRRISSVAKQSA